MSSNLLRLCLLVVTDLRVLHIPLDCMADNAHSRSHNLLSTSSTTALTLANIIAHVIGLFREVNYPRMSGKMARKIVPIWCGTSRDKNSRLLRVLKIIRLFECSLST